MLGSPTAARPASAASVCLRRARARRLVALAVEAALDKGGGIADVIAVRFEDETVDAQTLILQNPEGTTTHNFDREKAALIGKKVELLIRLLTFAEK